MQKFFLVCIFFLSIISSTFAAGSGDKLELSITPIRSDIRVEVDESTTGSVTLYNNSNQAYSFIMSAEDCTENSKTCTPVRTPGINPNSLASWIVFDTTGSFSIPAKGKWIMTYTINTPINAIPGGHYGVIYFNNINTTGGTSISMNRRIGSLLLVTVPGDIIVAPEFGSINITGGGGLPAISPISIWDLFSPNQTGSGGEKGKGFMMIFTDPTIQKPIIDFFNPFWSAPELGTGTVFITDINLPIDNKGTIHINPGGKITLHEADGTQLKNIGKELIMNQNGVIVGERIVDYLPINEEKGNVLPGTNRIFTMSWNGFAHEYITSTGSISIKYESPGEYYSRIARENEGYMYPWEKKVLSHTVKKINAKINLSYINPVSGEKIIQDSDVPITIEYDEVVKTWNTGLIFIIFLILLIRWLIKLRQKKHKHTHAEKSLMSYEIHALERARAMMYDKKKELSIRDEIKKKEKKIKHKKTTEIIPEITQATIKRVIKKDIITPVKRVIKKAPVVEKKAVRAVTKTVEKSVVTPVKRVIKKDIVTPVKRVIKKAPTVEKKAVSAVKKTVSKKVVTPVKRAIKKDIVTPVKRIVKKAPAMEKKAVRVVKKSVTKAVVTPVKRVIKKAPTVEKKAITTVKKTATKAVVTPVKKVIKSAPAIEKLPKIKEEKHSKKDHKKKHKK